MTTNEEWIIGHTPVKEEFPTFSMLFQRREGWEEAYFTDQYSISDNVQTLPS